MYCQMFAHIFVCVCVCVGVRVPGILVICGIFTGHVLKSIAQEPHNELKLDVSLLEPFFSVGRLAF